MCEFESGAFWQEASCEYQADTICQIVGSGRWHMAAVLSRYCHSAKWLSSSIYANRWAAQIPESILKHWNPTIGTIRNDLMI